MLYRTIPYRFTLSIMLLFFLATSFKPIQSERKKSLYSDQITAYIFLLDQCIISQYYTLPLREMHAEFGDQILFKGIFPTEGITEQRIDKFGKTYELKFDLEADNDNLATTLNATITPEVILYDNGRNKILYQGRIDNSYARVGKRRRHTTTNELLSAIKSVLNNKEIRIKKTDAIGCYIGKK